MSDEAAFLAAIRAAADDDTARLVFADWLDERDRLGGEYLRAEVSLSRVPFDSAKFPRAFVRYRAARAPLPEAWREAVERHPLAHWLALLTRGAWARLERWCRKYHPALLNDLAPGATAEQIGALESTIGQQLPADVRESFALHNGCGNLLFDCESLSTASAESDWDSWDAELNEELREGAKSFPPEAVALDYTNAGWVPLLADGGGNNIGVDLAPGPKGVCGQVIIFGRDEDEKCVLADSWGEFLSDSATFLESGAVPAFDPNDPGDWFSGAMDGHPHDALRNMRKNGTWPPNAPTDDS